MAVPERSMQGVAGRVSDTGGLRRKVSTSSSCQSQAPQTIQEQLRNRNGYLPIDAYGIIGNLRTVALVGLDGGLDFMCWPNFDSPSVFCRLLDKHIGGHFSIVPSMPGTSKQQYLPNSNVLTTKFLSEEGVAQITDLMYRSDPKAKSPRIFLPWVIRYVEVVRGTVEFDIECFPAFDYARARHTTDIVKERRLDRLSSHVPLGRALTQHSNLECLFPTYKHPQRVIFTSYSRTECRSGDEADKPEMVMDLNTVVGGSENGCPEFTWEVVERPGMKGPGVVTHFTLQEGERVAFVLRDIDTEEIMYEDARRKNRSAYSSKPSSSTVSATASTPYQYTGGTSGATCPQPPLPGANASEGHTDSNDNESIPDYNCNVLNINPAITMDFVEDLIDDTVLYWHNWIRACKYDGRWREAVERSALTLKLLTFEPTGAVVAAPTFSLPEHFGGSRNWDYRYVWIRDSAFTIYALMRLGLTQEAEKYMEFIDHLFQNKASSKRYR
ncbi:hypothetical protein EV182_004852 [Spiromyces aspiralis]|uniref:Uncharacterized protein n=1 Tax=Spiromyces aspiralis TaxID=68401 RepID=A0ACC1HUP5_9FUNG|nr:hypothetical protein EV182_004852 [Spiromyces aspiralis]